MVVSRNYWEECESAVICCLARGLGANVTSAENYASRSVLLLLGYRSSTERQQGYTGNNSTSFFNTAK